MVDFPRIPIERSVTDPPRSQVSGAEITSAYSALAAGLGAIGNRLEQAETADAALEGQNSVYRDADGAIKFQEKSNFTAAGREFNRGARVAALTTMASDSRQRLAEMRRAAKGDVKTFDAAARAYTNEMVGKADGLMKGPVGLQLEGDIAQTRTGMIEEQMRLDTVAQEKAIEAEIAFIDGEMGALAQQGGTATPEYAEKRAAIQTLYDELGGNTLFAKSPREIAVRLKDMEGRHMGEAILGKVGQIYEKDGLKAAQDFVDKGLSDSGLPLNPKQRRQYQGLAKKYLNGLKSENAAALKELHVDSRLMMEGLKAGQDYDAAEVDEMAGNLASLGDAAGAMRLLRQREVANFNKDWAAKPDREQAEELAVATGSRGFRNNNPGNIEFGDFAKGKGATGSDGRFARFDTPEEGVQAMAALLRSYQGRGINTVRKMIDRWNPKSDGQPGNYVPDVATAMGIDPDKEFDFSANPELAGKMIAAMIRQENGNNPYSLADIQAAIGGAKMSAAPGERLDPKISTLMRKEVAADSKALWSNMQQGLKKGFGLAPEDVDLLRTQINVLGDSRFGAEVGRFLRDTGIAEFPAATPVAQQNDMAAMAADGISADEVDILESKRAIYERTVKMLDDDPIGLVSERQIYSEPVAPLDLTSPEAAARSLQNRQRVASFVGEYYGREEVPALRPAEVAAMAGTFNSGAVDDQISLLQTLKANLRPETYMATVAKLAGKAGPVMGYAGGLMAKNPEAAIGILRGQSLLKTNPKLAPSGEKQDDAALMTAALPMSAIAPDMGQAYDAMMQSARARYADLSAEAGDQSGALNEDRWGQAVRDVTGGFVEYNGKTVIAPAYGMGQSEFDTTMAGLTDADIDGAVTRTGNQIGLSQFLNGAVLTSVGDGQYIVQLKTSVPMRGVMSTALPYVKSVSGKKFVLDLRPETRHMRDVNFGGGSGSGIPPNRRRSDFGLGATQP